MKKADHDELRPEYDFAQMKVVEIGPGRTKVGRTVRLEPDVAQKFPTADAVNEALRKVIDETKSA